MGKTLDELELRALLDTDPGRPRAPSPYARNARYLTSLDGFNIKRPAIPAHVFRAERDRWVAVEFEIRHASATHLAARARGVRVTDAPALVKAATLHEVRVDAVPGGVEAHVVLDI